VLVLVLIVACGGAEGSPTVAQKTVPMFCHFGKTGLA
jgi:hypothetical protein